MKMASHWNFNLPFSIRLGVELNLFIEQKLIESLLCASFSLGDGNIKVNWIEKKYVNDYTYNHIYIVNYLV